MILTDEIAKAVNHPQLDPQKSLRLVTSGAHIAAWISAGASKDLIVAVITGVMRTRKLAEGPVRAWSYFDEPIRRALAEQAETEKFDATVRTGPAAQRAKRARAADSVLAELDGVEAPLRAVAD